jgi:hypothetical protein
LSSPGPPGYDRGIDDKYILLIAGVALLGIYGAILVGPLLIPNFAEWLVAFASLLAAAMAIRGIAWWANLRDDRHYDYHPPDAP